MPKLQRVIALPATAGRAATPADFGSGLGLALLGDAAGAASAITLQIFEAASSQQVSKARAGLAVELNDFKDSLKDNPNFEEHEKLFEEFKIEATERQRKGISSERFRRVFDDETFAVVERSRMEIINGARAKAMAMQRGLEIEARQDHIGLAIKSETQNGQQQNLDLALEGIDKLERTGAITADRAALERVKTIKLVHNGLIFRMLREANSAEEVESVIEDLKDPTGTFADMDEDDRQRAFKDAERQLVFEIARDKAEIAEVKKRAKDLFDAQLLQGAIDGRALAHENKMTTLYVKENQHRLSGPMQKLFMKMAANGGGFLEAADFDATEHQRLQLLQLNDPPTYAREHLDPEKLGAKLAEHREAQLAILSGNIPTGQSFIGRVNDWLEGVGGSSKERALLRRLAEAELVEFKRATGKTADPTQQRAILDALELRRVRIRRLFPFLPDNTQVLPRHKPIQVEGVPQDQVPGIVDALILTGQGVSRESILNMWDNR